MFSILHQPCLLKQQAYFCFADQIQQHVLVQLHCVHVHRIDCVCECAEKMILLSFMLRRRFQWGSTLNRDVVIGAN